MASYGYFEKQNVKIGTRDIYETRTKQVRKHLGYERVGLQRAKFVFFEFTGLKPNTPHWLFFDNKNINNYVNTSFTEEDYLTEPKGSSIRNPGDKYINENAFPAEKGGPTNGGAGQPLTTSTTGTLSGYFFIQRNTRRIYNTGTSVMTAIDISIPNKNAALSYAQTNFKSFGLYDVGTQVTETYDSFVRTEDVYQQQLVQVPPPKRKSTGSGKEKRWTPTFRAHYEPSTNTVTYFDEPLTSAQIQQRRNDAGGKFNKSLGGGKNGGGGGEGSSQSSKVVCTAMNNAYGFGGFRNIIWLKYAADNLTKEHEVGYHTIFMPLVDRAYNRGDKNNMLLRKVLEHIARHRSADIRAELRNGKRDRIGQVERAFFEPLCYIVGKIKMRNNK